ncbi:hypothetical protein Pst134EA_032938 [Puccinia striiformis f. sp. tritici]|uniref:uncharacterized protein n=1 Tax=Puccinia striiformis f. sp. tritici TaxID=168172 RepID=UPI0020086F0C|nr:uncharacterized protein Pst134EA_032938 [Puccinia striiformis f. sp. tritici]KAH9443487.1 hypothetical protein Pst134EA_032938 [Puccinia striiformis f. sp. tritici]
MLEQSRGEDDGDEDDEIHDFNHKKNNGAPHGNNGPNRARREKLPILSWVKRLAEGRVNIREKGQKNFSYYAAFETIVLVRLIRSMILSSEPLPPCSNKGSFDPNAGKWKAESMIRMNHDMVDELDVLREPPSKNYHHQFTSSTTQCP